MSKLLVATNNRGKLVEIQALLEGQEFELLTPQDLNLAMNVDETGATYSENAALKGRAFALASGLPTLADDSGLEVDLLDGRPGLHSARFSRKPGATDADRRLYLLELLAGKPRPWQARFRCVVALASPGGKVVFAEGICPGEIIPEERGQDGFGYDPIFLLPDLGLTMAQLGMVQKNQLSHRGVPSMPHFP